MNSLARLLAFSNAWVALGAAGLTIVTAFSLPPERSEQRTIVLLILLGTFAAYNVCRIYAIFKADDPEASVLLAWYKKALPFVLIPTILCAGIAAYFFLQLKLAVMLTIVVAGFVFLLYLLPAVRFGGKWVGVRRLPFIKSILVAVVWMAITAWVPLQLAGDVSTTIIVLVLAERFLFIWGITIPFDIRDMAFDRQLNLKTLPNTLGIKTAKAVAIVVLFLQLMTCTAICWLTGFYPLLISGLITGAIAVFFVLLTNEKRKELWYTFGFDGLMVFYGVLFLVLVKCGL